MLRYKTHYGKNAVMHLLYEAYLNGGLEQQNRATMWFNMSVWTPIAVTSHYPATVTVGILDTEARHVGSLVKILH